MLVDDRSVLHRHVPAAEIDHATALGHMPIVQNGALAHTCCSRGLIGEANLANSISAAKPRDEVLRIPGVRWLPAQGFGVPHPWTLGTLPRLFAQLHRRAATIAGAGLVALDRADVAPVVDLVQLSLDDAVYVDDLQNLRVWNLACREPHRDRKSV